MTHHTRRLAAIAALLVVASTLAPIASAAPITPFGPTPSGTSTPEPTSTPTPPAPPSNSTPTGNGSGGGDTGNGGGGGNWVFNSISDGIIDAVEELGVDQAIEATGNLSTAALNLSAYTPHANRIGAWFHNPTNNAWPNLWDLFKRLGQPLWALTVGIGLLLGLAFRQAGLMSQPEFADWRRRWVVGLVGGRWAWELGNLYLASIGMIKAGILAAGVTSGPPLSTVLSAGLVLILIVALAWWSLAAVGLVVLIIVASVVGIEVLTPFLGVILAARAIPFQFINQSADKVAQMWAILPLLTLPMVLSLSIGFAVDLSGSSSAGGIVSVLMPILVFLGAVGFAVASPYIVWSSMSTAGALSVGFAGGSIAASKQYERAKEGAKSAAGKSREGARGARDAVRAARGKEPVADGGRGYDAGRAMRQTGSAARGNRKEGVRSRLRIKYAESKYASLESRRRRRKAVDKVRGPGRNSTLRGLVDDNENDNE